MSFLPSPAAFDTIADQLADQGWAVIPDFLPSAETARLAQDVRHSQAQGELRHAGVSKSRIINPELRGDEILWLSEPALTPAQRNYLACMESLRQSLNRSLQLGLFEFECHVAVYPSGSFYRKHLDNFQHSNQRVLTCILYLNQDWQDADGGQLRMYLDSGSTDISPTAGTLVAFLSSRYWHEVLPARRERLSMTGWFKQRDHT